MGRNGNPPGFLDSEDDAELKEADWREFKKKGIIHPRSS